MRMFQRIKPFFAKQNKEVMTESTTAFNGVNCEWLVLKSKNTEEVAHFLELDNIKPMHGTIGIQQLYSKRNCIYITPPIEGWVVIMGAGLLATGEGIQVLLPKLSVRFQEAYFFKNYDTGDTYCWMKAIKGTIERSFTYCLELGEWSSIGRLTAIEQTLNINAFIDSLNSNEEVDDIYIDINTVIAIADNWSISTTKIDAIRHLKELGCSGELLKRR